MLQSTINLIRQRTATKKDFMAMSKEDRGNLYLDLMDTAEHLMDNDDIAYCEKLLVVLEDIERNPVAVSKEEPEEEMRIVSITIAPYATPCGELPVPKDLVGEEMREYIRNHWNEMRYNGKLIHKDTDSKIESNLEEDKEVKNMYTKAEEKFLNKVIDKVGKYGLQAEKMSSSNTLGLKGLYFEEDCLPGYLSLGDEAPLMLVMSDKDMGKIGEVVVKANCLNDNIGLALDPKTWNKDATKIAAKSIAKAIGKYREKEDISTEHINKDFNKYVWKKAVKYTEKGLEKLQAKRQAKAEKAQRAHDAREAEKDLGNISDTFVEDENKEGKDL